MKKEEVHLILCILISMGMCLLLVFCGQHIKRAELTARAMENAGMGKRENDEEAETTEIKKIALTFDDGPNPEYTEKLLDGLKNREVKATFFLLGNQVELYPDIVKRMHEEGHLIGNHSYDHVNLGALCESEACTQIKKTNDAIYKVTGEYPEYLRPPFGSVKNKLDEDMNMIVTLWDIDTRDWEVQNVASIESKVLGKAKDGEIILMHDAYATSVTAALDLIDKMKQDGYEFVTVDELIFE